ncbi:Homeobox protein 4 [Fusarium oxysporum f. sp. albedinis]|nr:Homeobox protein 4 [Fusarium oxysporum f. sp. albedinis]
MIHWAAMSHFLFSGPTFLNISHTRHGAVNQSQMGHDTVPPETAPKARSLSRRSHNRIFLSAGSLKL